MPFIGGGHLWLVAILLVIVLIVKGPGKLPEVGSGLGRALREFKKATSDVSDAVHHEAPVAPASSVNHTEPAVVAPAALTMPAPAVRTEAPAPVESGR